ncbi:MAG TPA: hypothetical protein VGL93_18685 [Streptosporangiaceae bacterium]|jgi:hypothetical protein
MSVALAVVTAGGAVALAVVSTACDSCMSLPDPATPAPLSHSPSATPSGTNARLARALLTRFDGARVSVPARSGTYGALADVPLPGGAARDALSGSAPVTPAGCGAWPASGWTGTARPARAAAATLTVARAGGGTTLLREVLFVPAHRPSGLTLPARCRAFTVAGGLPARSGRLSAAGVGDAARGVGTLVGRRGAADRVALYTIVFRVGRVYGVVRVGGTGPAPGGAAVRRMAHDYAQRAATRTRGLT